MIIQDTEPNDNGLEVEDEWLICYHFYFKLTKNK